MPSAHRCVGCGAETPNSFNLCSPCNAARAEAAAVAQGHPPLIEDPVVLDRLDRLTRPVAS